MGRPRKEEQDKKFKLTVTIDKPINAELDSYVEKNMVVKSKLVQRIIKEFLEKENEKT